MKKIKLKKGSKEWRRRKLAEAGEIPAQNPMTILAGDMWVHYDFGNPNSRYEKFLSTGRPRFSRLLDSLILYDSVWVPTQDFMSITVLIGVLGDKAVMELLEAGDLKIIRLKGALAYVGNGGGLKFFEICGEGMDPDPCFADDEVALQWALSGLNKKPDPYINRLVQMNTKSLSMAKMNDLIKHETYQDVLESQHLREFFAIRNKNMNSLVGIEPNQIRIAEVDDSSVTGDEIDTVLRISRANQEMNLTVHAGCLDLTTGTPIGHLLKGKRERLKGVGDSFENYATLKELVGVPDLAAHVLDTEIELRHHKLSDILRPKHSRDGGEFRKWFHKNCKKDQKEIAKNYIDVLQQNPFVNSLPGKTIRFLVTTASGFLGPATGIVVGAIDSFLGDYLRRSSPKFFIEDLRQIK